VAGRKGKVAAGEVQDNPNAERRRRKKEVNRRTVSKKNRKLFREAVALANDGHVPILSGMRSIDVIQEVLDRAVAMMRFAQAEVDKLSIDELWVRRIDAQDNVIVEPHRWIQMEQVLRTEALEIADRMEKLNIDERRITLQEAESHLIQLAIRQVLAQLDLTPEQTKKVGPALRAAQDIFDGTAREIPTKELNAA
jgi:hypothetical protein